MYVDWAIQSFWAQVFIPADQLYIGQNDDFSLSFPVDFSGLFISQNSHNFIIMNASGFWILEL